MLLRRIAGLACVELFPIAVLDRYHLLFIQLSEIFSKAEEQLWRVEETMDSYGS